MGPPESSSPSSPTTAKQPAIWFALSAAIVLFVIVVAGLAWLLSPSTNDNPIATASHLAAPDSASRLSNLLTTVRLGDPPDAGELHELAGEHWEAIAPHLEGWLNDEQTAVRVLALRWIGIHHDNHYLPAVIARASDSDWRVRAAAFDVIDTLSTNATDLPQRDTPLAQREKALLNWLARHDESEASDGSSVALSEELCELYAGARFVEFASPLAERCMTCHVGEHSFAKQNIASESCAVCHEVIHRQWDASAHANSLSHLHLMTVEPETRQSGPWKWSPQRGLDCIACHMPVDSVAITLTEDHGGGRCEHVFRETKSNVTQCANCHAATHRQWLQWKDGLRPVVAAWPPGQVRMTQEGAAATCIDCHMPVDEGTGLRDHSWSARRDVEMLASAIHVRIGPLVRNEADRNDRPRIVPIVLTNLTGHAFPTGTRRRAVRIHAQFEGGHEAHVEQRVAELVPDRPGGITRDTQVALAPGEVRTLEMPYPETAQSITIRLTYVRDRMWAADKEMEFIRLTQALR